MTVTTAPDILPAYRKHFSLDDFTDDDRERICFLERIVTNDMPLENGPDSIAAETVRQWYENPAGPVRYQRMLAKVSEAPRYKAVFHHFRDCLAVLKDIRLPELFKQYEQALRARDHDTVDHIEKMIPGFEDEKADEQMRALKADYLASGTYKPRKPDRELSWPQIVGLGIASAVILAGATWGALKKEAPKPVVRTEQHEEYRKTEPRYSQTKDKKPQEPNYISIEGKSLR